MHERSLRRSGGENNFRPDASRNPQVQSCSVSGRSSDLFPTPRLPDKNQWPKCGIAVSSRNTSGTRNSQQRVLFRSLTGFPLATRRPQQRITVDPAKITIIFEVSNPSGSENAKNHTRTLRLGLSLGPLLLDRTALRSLGQWFGPAARANPNVGSSVCLLRRRFRRTFVRLQAKTVIRLGINSPRVAVSSCCREPRSLTAASTGIRIRSSFASENYDSTGERVSPRLPPPTLDRFCGLQPAECREPKGAGLRRREAAARAV